MSTTSWAANSLPRCPLVVCGDTPAAKASSVAVSARPPSNAHSILARAGSPTSAATSAIWGAFDMLGICARQGRITTANASLATEVNRVANKATNADVTAARGRWPLRSNTPTSGKTRIFYGWFVVAAAFAVTFVGFGCVYSFSAFIESLQRDFGAQRGSVSLVFSLAGFLYFSVGVVSGPLADRCGSRPMAVIGMILIGIGLAAASVARSLTEVYLAYGLGVGLGVGCSYVPAMGAVQRWFVKRRGFASGLAVSGIGVGTLVMPPLAAYCIGALGWRHAYLVLGIVAAVVGVGMALLIENDPRDRGLAPDGDPLQAGGHAGVPPGFSVGE